MNETTRSMHRLIDLSAVQAHQYRGRRASLRRAGLPLSHHLGARTALLDAFPQHPAAGARSGGRDVSRPVGFPAAGRLPTSRCRRYAS